MTADAGAGRIGLADEPGLWIFVVPGLTYPAWHLLAPAGAADPWWVWFALSACFLGVAACHRMGWIPRSRLAGAVPVIGSGVALHFFLLAAWNDMQPFYAVGSTMAGLAVGLFIRSRGGMVVYAAFIVALSVVLYAVQPDPRKLAYWGALIPVLVFVYYQVAGRVRYRRVLEQAVAERTRQLSESNRRLLAEIEERARLEDELRVTHKMEAVGRLAGGIAHDFNNALTTIGVYAGLLEKGLAADDPHRAEIAQIQSATRQAAALTQQLLTVGRRSQAELDVVDLDEVVASTASVLAHLAREEVEVVCVRGEGSHRILANPDQVQQILINLVTNARDAMDGRGRVRIATSRCNAAELPARDVEAPRVADTYVCLTVEDTGRGMSTETLARIFDPFFTTKQPDQGVGLGLAIVHGSVSQAGGFVRASSQPGRGSRFDLYWPRTEGAPAPLGALGAPPATGEQRGSEEILLVEDEAELRGALARVLRSRGYRVSEAQDGEQALAMVLARERPLDLLVTDVVMVHMNGFELARRVVGRDPHTRVLLISGHLSEQSLEDLEPGLPFLAKPFGAGQLVESVRAVLDAKAP